MKKFSVAIIFFVHFSIFFVHLTAGGRHESPYGMVMQSLIENLMGEYLKEVRPVENPMEVLNVSFAANLIQLLDVDEKNQILTTNVWLEMTWVDAHLRWNPEEFGGIKVLHIPSKNVWTPDLVLNNNAAGDPQITIWTDVLVEFTGKGL